MSFFCPLPWKKMIITTDGTQQACCQSPLGIPRGPLPELVVANMPKHIKKSAAEWAKTKRS